jgi:hypothetical protein
LLSDAGVSPLYAVLNVQWAPIAAYPQPRSHLQQSRDYLDVMKLLLDKGADPNARVPAQGLVLGLQLRSVGRRRGRRDAALARRVCRGRRRDEAARFIRRRPVAADDETVFAPRTEDPVAGADKSGLPPIVIGGPGATPLHAAAGPGYRDGLRG